MKTKTEKAIPYGLCALAAGLGFASQLIVASFWSAAFGNELHVCSLTLAFYLLGLGVSGLWASHRTRAPVKALPALLLLSALWTAYSLLLIRWGIERWGNVFALPLLMVTITGMVTGPIPFLAKTRRTTQMIWDAGAAMVFTLIFVHGVLIRYGYGIAVLSLSLFTLVGVFLLLWFAKVERSSLVLFVGLLIGSLPYPLYLRQPKVTLGESAKIVTNLQTRFQKIVLTEERGDNQYFPGIPQHTLYLNGSPRFTSQSEQQYHTCLVNVPVWASEYNGTPARSALILGGGDGLAARNLLSVPKIKRIKVADFDSELIQLAKQELNLRIYNLDALRHPKVSVYAGDIVSWVRDSDEIFDIIVIDFPPPKSIFLARLYSAEFYRAVLRLLSPNGFLVVQSGPGFKATDRSLSTLSKVTTSIRATLRAIGMNTSVYINSKDNEAFTLVSKNSAFKATSFYEKLRQRLSLSAANSAYQSCVHSAKWKEQQVAINTLNATHLTQYWRDWKMGSSQAGPFFRAEHSVFLPN